jgi:glycosyltransferase involved in cell wall biosynthesis
VDLPLVNIRFAPYFFSDIKKIDHSSKVNLIHDHGLWLQSNYASNIAAKSLNIPFVVSTRGMLEPWAIKYHRWRKDVVWFCWQKKALERASLLHATSCQEFFNLRNLGLKNPIAIIPNGVDLPMRFCEVSCGVKTALFLSRVHPKKGLKNLIDAWAIAKPDGWRMIVVGPSDDNYLSELQCDVKNAGLSDVFQFVGSVSDVDKWKYYQDADLFILPTYSENFGIVVAEALSAGVPVITTKGTPWSELIEQECGWWVEIGVEPLVLALKEATSLSDAQRLDMGRRGRQLVKNNYSWVKIAEDMSMAYQWILNGGTPPACVRLD